MEKWKKRSVDLLSSLAFGSDGTPAVVPYYPQKTKISSYEERFFRRTTPERQGISSTRMYSMLSELEANTRVNMHSIMVLCNDEVISECSREGYNVNIAHLSHSMSKTVCGLIIGILVADGALSIDDRVCEIFPEISYKDRRFAEITVNHLLTMTSGVDFAEAGSITESEWTKAFFNSTLRFTPGAKFAYNSMNSYILARIAERATGESFGKIAAERFFDPLSIKNYFWEKSPEGTEKGGWGLYMSVESWAKVGTAFLNGGRFLDRRIFPAKWLEMSVTNKVDTALASEEFDYGYHVWTLRAEREYLFNGMLGQNVWICPRNRIVVVITSENNELFQDSPALKIIRKYLGGEIRDEINRKDARILREKENSFFENRRKVRPKERRINVFSFFKSTRGKDANTAFSYIAGEYRFGKNNVGILPLLVRAMQNNLNSSIERLGIEYIGGELWLTVVESGEEHKISVGIHGYKSTVLNFRGEKYIVRSVCEAIRNRNGQREYRIELIFPELPNSRLIRITRESDGKIRLEMSENPNAEIAKRALLNMSESSPVISLALDVIKRRFGDDAFWGTIEKAFSSSLVGIDVTLSDCDKMIEEEAEKQRQDSRSVKLIKMVVDRFFRDNESKAKEPSDEKNES